MREVFHPIPHCIDVFDVALKSLNAFDAFTTQKQYAGDVWRVILTLSPLRRVKKFCIAHNICTVITVMYSCVFMAAPCNRGPLYFCPVVSSFYLSFFFFPRLIPAVADWMYTIVPHMVWP